MSLATDGYFSLLQAGNIRKTSIRMLISWKSIPRKRNVQAQYDVSVVAKVDVLRSEGFFTFLSTAAADSG